MDKQLNARINPDIYNRIKSVKSDSKLTMNTLVEQLLEIGLNAYLQGNLSPDSSSYISQVESIESVQVASIALTGEKW